MSKKIFLGIGAGPIQTGIFVAGAAAGGFERIVLADVDTALVEALRRYRSITVNTAGTDAVRSDRYAPVEIYNPDQAADLAVLIETASQADVINTALPAPRGCGKGLNAIPPRTGWSTRRKTARRRRQSWRRRSANPSPPPAFSTRSSAR